MFQNAKDQIADMLDIQPVKPENNLTQHQILRFLSFTKPKNIVNTYN
jgi:hypothetical protein